MPRLIFILIIQNAMIYHSIQIKYIQNEYSTHQTCKWQSPTCRTYLMFITKYYFTFWKCPETISFYFALYVIDLRYVQMYLNYIYISEQRLRKIPVWVRNILFFPVTILSLTRRNDKCVENFFIKFIIYIYWEKNIIIY